MVSSRQEAFAADALELRPVVPRSDLTYRPFLIASLLLGSLIGFVLGLHVALSRLLDIGRPERTADLIQAHGQAQLLGFAGLYVIGMSLRLLPRFSGGSLKLPGLLPLVWWPMVSSLLLRAVVMPLTSGETHHALLLVSTFGVMVAAGVYLLVVAATLSYGARRPDASGAAFLLGALALYTGGVIATLVVIDQGSGGSQTVPYLADTAVTLLELLGFIIVTIVGVALRALPVLVGRERPERGAALLPFAVVTAVGLQAGALLYLQYASYATSIAMLADAGVMALGIVLMTFVWQAGVLRPHANRTRPASQPALWLLRSAFTWLLLSAALMVYYGSQALIAQELVAQPEFDAVRHAVGLGLVTNLILGMSLMILPEFAGERQYSNGQRLLALVLAVLIDAAAVLRVVPAIAGDAWSAHTRDLSMSLAGSLAEVALLLFAAYLLRLIWRDSHAPARRGA